MTLRQQFIFALISVAATGIAHAGAAKPLTKADQSALAHEVRSIFQAKCVDCHGPELPRPKGKFGYVLDLKRVAANPDFVMPGAPEMSELYLMVRDDEMPGEDADVPPLTEREKEVVKRWIAAGAPHKLPATVVKSAPISSLADKPVASLPTWKRAIRFLGRFHPVSTHFPVALMYVAVLAEGLAWFTRRENWMQTIRFLVVLGALGAVAAASLGWINAAFTSYVGSSATILKYHRWLGTFTAVWTVICAGLAVMAECKEGSPDRQRFRGALLVGGLLVGISGFLGSALIFGLDHYSW
jgi:uncharacterized membrane protein